MFWGFRHDTKATDRSKPSSTSISQVMSKLGLDIDSKLWEIENILLLLDRKKIFFFVHKMLYIFKEIKLQLMLIKWEHGAQILPRRWTAAKIKKSQKG